MGHGGNNDLIQNYKEYSYMIVAVQLYVYIVLYNYVIDKS